MKIKLLVFFFNRSRVGLWGFIIYEYLKEVLSKKRSESIGINALFMDTVLKRKNKV